MRDEASSKLSINVDEVGKSVFWALTVMATSSLLVRAPSVVLTRNTYVPFWENAARVSRVFGALKVTLAGPDICVQEKLSAPGDVGSPSSFVMAVSDTSLGREIV